MWSYEICKMKLNKVRLTMESNWSVPLNWLAFDFQNGGLWGLDHSDVHDVVVGQAGVQLGQKGQGHLLQLELPLGLIHGRGREVDASHDECLFIPWEKLDVSYN